MPVGRVMIRGCSVKGGAMPRILVVHPHLRVHGGGEGVCAWVVQALCADHRVTLFTWEPVDWDAVNAFYGTSIAAGDVEVRLAWPSLPGAMRRPARLRRLHLWSLAAAARRLPGYDLRFAVDEETDLGGGGLQYVHYPRLQYVQPEELARRPGWHATLIRAYYTAIAAATGTRLRRMRDNVTIVNSDWTGALVRRVLGVEPVTIHPPAAGPFDDVPWERRADRFVALGRLAVEKRYEVVIDVLERVRARGHAVTLTIVAGGSAQPAYARRIAGLVAERPWVRIVRDVTRRELAELLAGARYGIHGNDLEHFGMAVAEMVVAGQIPFVPNGGGQVEIVADERLVWSDADDAAAKIVRVLRDPALAADLRARLAARREHLMPPRFVREVRELVGRALISGGAQ